MNPIHFHTKYEKPNHEHHKLQKTGWYFWNETWGDRYGPYKTEESAEQELNRYAREVLGEREVK